MVKKVAAEKPGWTFLSNYSHVLICIDRDPTIRTKDIAAAVGITERATQAIVADLAESGYLTIERVGRRNLYTVSAKAPFRHPLEAAHTVGDLLNMLDKPSINKRRKAQK